MADKTVLHMSTGSSHFACIADDRKQGETHSHPLLGKNRNFI